MAGRCLCIDNSQCPMNQECKSGNAYAQPIANVQMVKNVNQENVDAILNLIFGVK